MEVLDECQEESNGICNVPPQRSMSPEEPSDHSLG